MRNLVVGLLLSAPLLAGCIGDADDLDTQSGVDADLSTVSNVVRFDANGGLLPIDDVVGRAEYALTGFQGAEPNVGITSSGAIFATAGDQVIRSLDNGTTWESVWWFAPEDDGLPLPSGIPFVSPERGVLRSYDPMLWVDPVTDIVYGDPMWPPLACSWLAISEDDGESWLERPAVCHPPPMDHQKLTSGVPGPEPNPAAGVAHETVLYQCYNQLLATECGVSYDGGLTWVVHNFAALFATDGCGGINGHPMASDSGVVAVPITSCDEAGLAISRDSGLTWSFSTLPGGLGIASIDAEVSWSPEGALYYSFRGDDEMTYVTRSDDEGGSWTDPVSVTAPHLLSTVFHAMAAGPDGRLAIAYLGTDDSDDEPSDAPEDTRWHLYIVTSENANAEVPEFTAHQVTPDEDPVQIGCVWLGGGGGGERVCRNLLDFIDGAVSPDGTFHVIYTEGCTEECAFEDVDDEMVSRSRDVAIASLPGWSLTG